MLNPVAVEKLEPSPIFENPQGLNQGMQKKKSPILTTLLIAATISANGPKNIGIAHPKHTGNENSFNTTTSNKVLKIFKPISKITGLSAEENKN